MKKYFLTNLLIFIFIPLFYSQSTCLINDEIIAQFAGIKKAEKPLDIIPLITFPIKYIELDRIYKYDFEINKTSTIPSIVLEKNCKISIYTKQGSNFLSINSNFPPHNQQGLARLFYQLGIEKINLNGEIVSVYKYANEYKALSHNELLKTRVYLKN